MSAEIDCIDQLRSVLRVTPATRRLKYRLSSSLDIIFSIALGDEVGYTSA